VAAVLYSLILPEAASEAGFLAGVTAARLPRNVLQLDLWEHRFPASPVRLYTLDEPQPARLLWALTRGLGRRLGAAYYYHWDETAAQVELWRVGPEGRERLFRDQAGRPADLDYEVRDVFGAELVSAARASAIQDFRDRYASREPDEDYTGLAQAVSLGEQNLARWDEALFEQAREDLEEETRRCLLDAVMFHELGVENDVLLGRTLRPERYPPRSLVLIRSPGFLGLRLGPWTLPPAPES